MNRDEMREKWNSLLKNEEMIILGENIITSLDHINYFLEIQDLMKKKYKSISFYYYCTQYNYKRMALTIHLNERNDFKSDKWSYWWKNQIKPMITKNRDTNSDI